MAVESIWSSGQLAEPDRLVSIFAGWRERPSPF